MQLQGHLKVLGAHVAVVACAGVPVVAACLFCTIVVPKEEKCLIPTTSARRSVPLSPTHRPQAGWPGDSSVQYLVATKPCACADRPGARHGLTSASYVSLAANALAPVRPRKADVLRTQVEGGQQFRKHVEAYWQACEQWPTPNSKRPRCLRRGRRQKGVSKRRLKPRSSRRSKPRRRRRRRQVGLRGDRDAARRKAMRWRRAAVSHASTRDTSDRLDDRDMRLWAPARYAGRHDKTFEVFWGR